MNQSTPLFEAQKVALDKLTAAVVPKYVEFLAAQVPDVLNARVDTFIQYETALVGQVQNQVALAMPTRYVALRPEELSLVPFGWRLNITPGRRENITPWIREIEMAMTLALAISHLSTSGSRWLSPSSMEELESGL